MFLSLYNFHLCELQLSFALMICLLLVTCTAFLILLLLLFLLLVDNCCVLWLTWPLTHVLTVVQSTVICTFCFTSTLSVESVDGIQRTNFNQTPVIIQLPTATVRSLDTHHTLLMSIDLWLLFLFHTSWFALPCTWQKQRGDSKLINPVSISGRLELTYHFKLVFIITSNINTTNNIISLTKANDHHHHHLAIIFVIRTTHRHHPHHPGHPGHPYHYLTQTCSSTAEFGWHVIN